MTLPLYGMDEVGRGALAGPLVAAAVSLSLLTASSIEAAALVDSKLLADAERVCLDRWIRRNALAVAVLCIGPEAINTLGIGWANRVIYARLMAGVGPGRFIVDGNLHLRALAPVGSVIVCRCGGDRSNRQVAAASIIAKVFRDRLLRTMHEAYPAYGWVRNVGYATAEHRRAIMRFGPCAEHRTLYLRRIMAEDREE